MQVAVSPAVRDCDDLGYGQGCLNDVFVSQVSNQISEEFGAVFEEIGRRMPAFVAGAML
jgi:hypothetical protein